MTESTARSILRILAVVTMFVGWILTSLAILGLISARSTLQVAGGMDVQASGVVDEMGFYAVLGQVLVIVWSAVLYASSPRLARHIVA
jgi:hypothetical protein